MTTGRQPGGASRTASARVRPAWISLFCLAWFAIWTAQQTPTQLLLPEQLNAPNGPDRWVDGVVYFGVVFAGGGIASLIAGPVAGALSDRTRSRFGRRRPWMFAGLVIAAASLVALGRQSSALGVGLVWIGVSVGIAMATAGYTAMVADQVPSSQRGFVSGFIGAPQAAGVIVGVGLIVGLGLDPRGGYLLLAAILLGIGLPTVFLLPDPRVPARDERRRRLTSGRRPASRPRLARGGQLWVSPREHPDFYWVLSSRAFVNVGNALGTVLLLYFLMYGLHDDDASAHLLLLISVYTVFVVIASLVGGRISDRIGRRRLLVGAASMLQAAAAIILAVAPSLETAEVSAALLGLGYGSFLSVDLALATEVLPDDSDHAKDMGLMNMAAIGPQTIAPLFGAWIVAATGGFTWLFIAAAVFSAVGALILAPVKRVR